MNELNKDRLELRKVKAIENVAKELRALNDILKECKEQKVFEEKKKEVIDPLEAMGIYTLNLNE